MTHRKKPHNRTRALIATAAAAALTGAAPAGAWAAAPQAPQPGPRGHDVSSHQGKIDWEKAKSNGSRFVYAKATEGTTYTNPYFSQQFDGARKEGILRGAYHFGRPDTSGGSEQARHFLAHGGRWKADGWTLPPALDLEAGSAGYCHGVDSGSMRKWIRDFSAEVLDETGRRPVIYTSARWWKECTGNSREFAEDHPLWLADWGRTHGETPGGWQVRTVWQYATKGPLPGDQNVFNGSMEQLRSYARG